MDKKQKIYKTFNMETKSTDESKREIEAVASVQTKDRDGDVLMLDGLDIKNFKKNKGPILWSHDASQPPIAKAVKAWIDGKKLMMKLQFADLEEYGFADTIYKLIKGGYINNLSVGFRPNWEKAEFNEKNKGYDFKESELLETSIVNVPANTGARIITRSLDDAVFNDIIDEIERKEIEIYLTKAGIIEEKEDEEKTIPLKKDENNNLTVDINALDVESFTEFAKDNLESMTKNIDDNQDVDKKPEQTNEDYIHDLKKRVDELETQIKNQPIDTQDDIYDWIFSDTLDNKSLKSNPDEDLVTQVLNQVLGYEDK